MSRLNASFSVHLTILVSFAFRAMCLSAQAPCPEIAATALMARANSTKMLVNAKKQAGEGYRTNLVYAYRFFQLHRNRTAAERLLSLIPTNDAQQTTLITLGDRVCAGESSGDQLTLSKVSEGMAREWANAVILVPQLMSAYVSYSFEAVQDPHSDYAVRMKRVCQQSHTSFTKAVKQLPKDKQQWFTSHVMDPASCKPLALPEAE